MTKLPFNLIESDLKYPSRPEKYDWSKPQPFDVLHTLTIHRAERVGWVIATLHIANPGRRSLPGAQARTYAVTEKGSVCRVGLGPHIKETHQIYVTRARLPALQGLMDLYEKGMADAGSVRDRISSRRAEGQVKRAAGLYSWRWDN